MLIVIAGVGIRSGHECTIQASFGSILRCSNLIKNVDDNACMHSGRVIVNSNSALSE